MSNTIPKVVAGLFYAPNGFKVAMAELRWTVRQNPDFWKTALLYVDPDCASRIRPFSRCFGEVVVDCDMPAVVKANRMWNCKGWWAHQAVQRFGPILYCDFDVVVLRQPDAALGEWLGRSPRFLYMHNYKSPNKVVGCGCAYYDETCDWDKYLNLIYNKWHCDERAWTETLDMTKENQLARGFDMNPKIVNWDWLALHPNMRHETYLIHGLSDVSRGWVPFRQIGYEPGRYPFHIAMRIRVAEFIRRLGLTAAPSKKTKSPDPNT